MMRIVIMVTHNDYNDHNHRVMMKLKRLMMITMMMKMRIIMMIMEMMKIGRLIMTKFLHCDVSQSAWGWRTAVLLHRNIIVLTITIIMIIIVTTNIIVIIIITILIIIIITLSPIGRGGGWGRTDGGGQPVT